MIFLSVEGSTGLWRLVNHLFYYIISPRGSVRLSGQPSVSVQFLPPSMPLFRLRPFWGTFPSSSLTINAYIFQELRICCLVHSLPIWPQTLSLLHTPQVSRCSRREQRVTH